LSYYIGFDGYLIVWIANSCVGCDAVYCMSKLYRINIFVVSSYRI